MKTDASMQHRVMCHKHEYADARSNSIRRSNRVHDAFQCGRSNVRLDAGDLTLREREMLQTPLARPHCVTELLGTGRKKLSILGTSGDHLGPLGTIWGPSFEEVIDF